MTLHIFDQQWSFAGMCYLGKPIWIRFVRPPVSRRGRKGFYSGVSVCFADLVGNCIKSILDVPLE